MWSPLVALIVTLSLAIFGVIYFLVVLSSKVV